MSCFFMTVHIHGSGGHSSKPHLTKNPILIGFEVIELINTRLFYQISGFENVNIQLTAFDAGTQSNIIPETADIKLKGIYETKEEHSHLIEVIEQSLESVKASWGITYKLSEGDCHE